MKPRFRLKQRMLLWFFEVRYVPGKTNLAADAASLYPTLSSEINSHDYDLTNESLVIASLKNELRRSIAITLNEKLLSRVFRCIEEGRGFVHDESLSASFRYDGALYVSD